MTHLVLVNPDWKIFAWVRGMAFPNSDCPGIYLTAILGLNLGHDAGAAVIVDGIVLSCILRERVTRIKHVPALDRNTVEIALAEAGLKASDIDAVGIVTAQTYPYVFDGAEFLSFKFGIAPGHRKIGRVPEIIARNSGYSGAPHFHRRYELNAAGIWSPDHVLVHYGMDYFARAPEWMPEGNLDHIATKPMQRLFSESAADCLYAPLVVTLEGRTVPGYMLAHHFCHAASAYYSSEFDHAAIFTHDGGASVSYIGGMFYYGEGNRIFPLTPHHLCIGPFYEFTSQWLGLGSESSLGPQGAAGKMMGLAAYGSPDFFDERLVGNWYDISERLNLTWTRPTEELMDFWYHHVKARCAERGLSTDSIGDKTRILDYVPTAIAASAQKIFEESLLAAGRAFVAQLSRNAKPLDNLCMSGGTALNVITNQRVVNELPFKNVMVNPGCDDSGLAIGAAFAVQHGILDEPRRIDPRNHSAYFGRAFSQSQVIAAIEARSEKFHYAAVEDAPRRAAQDIADGKLVAWFEGKSEIGPRALGHRSLIADPRPADMWPRVNRIKGREAWRPLAPSVLDREQHRHFGNLPVASHFMCFNASVISDQIPAVTHHDRTARIQTVTPASGGYYRLIDHFMALTGIGVVMNTSLNGPGEPIVDTPGEALNFLLNHEIDALYMEGIRVTRRDRPAGAPADETVTSR